MNRFTVLRQLGARYWSPLGSLMGLAAAGVTFAKNQKLDWTTALFAGIALLLFIAARFPRVAVFVTDLLLPQEREISDRLIFRGPRPYTTAEADAFFGRERDRKDCLGRITSPGFFTLDGESGCGKSSFLNAALLPLLGERFAIVQSGVQKTPMRQLYDALREAGTKLNVAGEPSASQVLAASREVAAQAPKPILLVIDQFEELFLTVKEEERRNVLALLRDAAVTADMTVLVAIRTDFLDLLLAGCRAVEGDDGLLTKDYFSLAPFRAQQAEDVLSRMLGIDDSGDPVRNQSLTDFATLLTAELLRPPRDLRLPRSDEKTVLPVELQIVGMTAERLSPEELTPRVLRERGGKAGLLRTFVDSAADHVYRRSRIARNDALSILTLLSSPTQTKRPPETTREIASRSRFEAAIIGAVLDAFAEQYLVRVVARPEGEGTHLERAYELMHDRLAMLLHEAPEPFLQKQRDAKTRFAFWNDRARANTEAPRRRWSWLRQPMPILEAALLWRHGSAADERLLLRQSVRGWLSRVTVAAIPVVVAVAVWQVWIRRDAYQIDRIIATAPLQAIPAEQRQAAGQGWSHALAVSGHAEDALRAARSMSDPQRLQSIAENASVLALIGRHGDAVNLIKAAFELDRSWQTEYGEALEVIAKMASTDQERAATLAAVELLPRGEARARSFLAVARGFDASNATGNVTMALNSVLKESKDVLPEARTGILITCAELAVRRREDVVARRFFDQARDAARESAGSDALLAYAAAVLPYCCIDDGLDGAIRAARATSGFSSQMAEQYRTIAKILTQRGYFNTLDRIADSAPSFQREIWEGLLCGAVDAGAERLALTKADAVGAAKAYRCALTKQIEANPSADISRYAGKVRSRDLEEDNVDVLRVLLRAGWNDVVLQVLRSDSLGRLRSGDVLVGEGLLSENDLPVSRFRACEAHLYRAVVRSAKEGTTAFVPLSICEEDHFFGPLPEYAVSLYIRKVAEADAKLAVKLASSTKNGRVRDAAVAVLVEFLTERGQYGVAREVARSITDEDSRSRELGRAIAASLETKNPLRPNPGELKQDDLDLVTAAEAISEARKGRFHAARARADELPPQPRLAAYQNILLEHTRRHGSKAQQEKAEPRSYAALFDE